MTTKLKKRNPLDLAARLDALDYLRDDETNIDAHEFCYVNEFGWGARGDVEIIPAVSEFPPDKMAKLETWQDVQKWFRSQYHKRRNDRPSGASALRINARPRKGGPFVAVDSEGINIGEPTIRGKGENKKIIQKQRSILWMAGGAGGFEDRFLADPNTLDRERIWEWLTSLPRFFSGPNADDAAPIFVGFGFNYDVGQLVAGMPYRKVGNCITAYLGTSATMKISPRASAAGF